MTTELKTYTIEISRYPVEFEIKASSEKEAIRIASEKFYNQTGASIYETKVTNIE